MKREIKILSPCGILGYGYPVDSFMRGMDEKPDAIVVDAGSTDAGPHKLGAGKSIVSRFAAKRDIETMLVNGMKAGIPVIIGSAGGAGARVHVEWTLDIIREIMSEHCMKPKIAVIWSDISHETVLQAMEEGKIQALGNGVKPLTKDILGQTHCVVSQMGHEPIVEALKAGAQLIVCGRAYDASIFAAVGIFHGFDPGLSYHMGKILECGAICAEPGSAKDCILGILDEESFLVKPLNPARKCTVTSVAAHTFYEKEHPYLLHGPGFILDLEDCTFTQEDESSVRVRNSRFAKQEKYYIKLEGARQVAYRTFVIAGIRDPILLKNLDKVEKLVVEQVVEYYSDISTEEYRIDFINYGKNGVMGDMETEEFCGHEVGVVIDVVARTQELASAICSTVRSTFLHYGFEGRKSTAGNLAFPYAPSDIDFGAVYEFSVYHLMEVPDGRCCFTMDMMEGQG